MKLQRLFNHKVLIAIDVTGSVSAETAMQGILLCYKLQDNGIDTKFCCWDGACGPIKTQQTENLSDELGMGGSFGGANPDCVFNALEERGEHFDKIVIVTDGYFDLASDRPTVKNRDKVIFLYHEDHYTHPGFEEYLLSETI